MTGHHDVKSFSVHPNHLNLMEGHALPDGWKPFAVLPAANGYVRVIARRWVRT